MNEFIEWLRYNRGVSEYTIRNYSGALKLFDEYLKQIGNKGVEESEDIKMRHIDGFVWEQRFLKGKNERTVNNYLSGIKLFLRFELIQGKDVESYNKVMFVKEHRKKIDALSEEDCVKLFEYFRNVKYTDETEELIKTRNLCIVSLFMYTGLRLSELADLKCKEIGEDMVIEGKGGKNRYISIHDDDLRLLRLYMLMRKDDSEWLFVSHCKGKQSSKLSKVTIETIIREGAKNAGIEAKVFPHKLRHTFATNLLRCNAPLPHIQKLLGHSNLTTTQIYLTVLNTEIKKTLNGLHRFC